MYYNSQILIEVILSISVKEDLFNYKKITILSFAAKLVGMEGIILIGVIKRKTNISCSPSSNAEAKKGSEPRIVLPRSSNRGNLYNRNITIKKNKFLVLHGIEGWLQLKYVNYNIFHQKIKDRRSTTLIIKQSQTGENGNYPDLISMHRIHVHICVLNCTLYIFYTSS